MNRRSFLARLTGAIVAAAVAVRLVVEDRLQPNPVWVSAEYEEVLYGLDVGRNSGDKSVLTTGRIDANGSFRIIRQDFLE